ncbi:MAG: choice-of-anchor J domain-containing protein [Prevotella sp.]|nr:choice-of-anchor J domain-containing protein [Prevotella sp.]MCM1075702.1 choice-of-anchor J domain-containing protein [Ruminococcus sp.]
MRKLYTTLLLMMALIAAVAPPAWAKHSEPEPLPWTPRLGKILGSINADWEEYLRIDRTNREAGESTSAYNGSWSGLANTGCFTSIASSTGTQANYNKTPHNDYLFLPPMEFEAGECYVIAFEAAQYAKYRPLNLPGEFSLTLAQTRDKAGAEAGQVIMHPTSVPMANTPITHGTPFIQYFVPEKSGVQSLVFKCTSLGGAGNFVLFNVNETMSVKHTHTSLPQAPTDLKATPDASGKKEVTVSFKAPTLTVLGQPVQEMTFINVYVDGNIYEKIDNPVPGQEYSVTLKASQSTSATVAVRAGNTHGLGDAAEVNCTIGYELKKADTKQLRSLNGIYYDYVIRASFHNNTVNLKWLETEGENVTYSVVRMPDGKIIAEDISELTVTDPELKSDFPANFQYQLTAKIDGVAQTPVYSNAIGINNEMPYMLSWPNERSGYECTFIDNSGHEFSSIDGGRGMSAGWGTTEGEWFFTPSVKLEPGKHYRIETATGNWLRPVHFEIKAGIAGNTPDDMTVTMMEEFLETNDINDGGTEHDGFFTVPEAGAYFIGVKAWTDTNSPETMCVKYLKITEVSNQLPAAVENLSVKFNQEDPTKATLSFNVPTKSIAGIDLTEVTRVDVYKDSELLASIDNPTPGALETFDIEAKMGEQIIYKIVPVLGETEGVPTELPVCILVAPYENDFKAMKNAVGYTIIDNDRNGFTWNIYNGAIRAYATDNSLDEWLIAPPMHLEGGYFYKVQYTTSLEDDDNGTSNTTVTLFVGDDPSIENLTRVAVPEYAPTMGANSMVLLKDYVWIEETGEYYFAWHAKGNRTLWVDNFSVSDKINKNVPDKALDLKIVPDKLGAMQGEVSFTSPTQTLKGDPLYGNIDYVVYRDGAPVYSVTTTPNKHISFTDKGMTEGVHLYSVYPTNTYGLGREAEDVAFFGVNRPTVPENFQVRETDTYGTVLLTWDAPSTDYDGFPINPDLIEYEIFTYNPYAGEGEPMEVSIAKGIKAFSYTHLAKKPTDPQEFIRYGIRARTTKGGSQGLLAQYWINVGEPYALPLKESFKSLKPKVALMQQNIDGYAAWGYSIDDGTGVTNFDDDNGMALMEVMFADSEARLFTGKVRISGENPVLTLYLYNNKNLGEDTNIFTIEAGNPRDWSTVESKTVNEWADGREGWQKIRVDLSNYKDEVIHLAFRAKAVKYTFTHMDAISIGEAGMDDLTLTQVDAPRRVNPGEEFEMKATVKNNGLSDADIYTLRMYREGQLLKSISGVNIKPDEVKTFTFTDEIDKNDDDNVYHYTFDVRYSPDCDLADNTRSNIQVSVRPSDYLPKVEELTATVNDVNNITLSWKAPELQTEAKEIVDGAETYAAWEGADYIQGDWENIDQDKGSILYGVGLETLPIAQRAKEGWFIMDTSCPEMKALNKEFNFEFYNAHSGTQCFAAPGLYDREAICNDWLISPELSGEAQTVKFWVRNCHPSYSEAFIFCTSEATSNIRDFNEVGSAGYGTLTTDWQEFSYDVPAGTKYFAIRHVSMAGFYMMVDDITFTPAGSERLNLEGFKVYHNGSLLETVGKDAVSYSHSNVEDGAHNYAVAAKYDKGESADATASVSVSSLGGIYIDGPQVYGLKGTIAVSNAEGMAVNVYSADGVHLYSSKGNDIFRVQPGVYVVTVDKASFKVIVK